MNQLGRILQFLGSNGYFRNDFTVDKLLGDNNIAF